MGLIGIKYYPSVTNETEYYKNQDNFFCNRNYLIFQITSRKKQFDIARQILKSGTSIGANVAEAQGAISENDFSNKMCIAYKESLETEFWLTIIRQANIVDSELCHEIQEKVIVISKVLFSILKTMRRVTRIPKVEIN